MSVVRLLSTVLAIFVTFLWAGFVVNAWQKNTMARQLAQNSPDKTKLVQSQAEIGTAEKAKGKTVNAQLEQAKQDPAKLSKTQIDQTQTSIDETLAKADELARAANEEFSKRIKIADAKILKSPSVKEVKKIDASKSDVVVAEKIKATQKDTSIQKDVSVAKVTSITEKTKETLASHESVVSKGGDVTPVDVNKVSDKQVALETPVKSLKKEVVTKEKDVASLGKDQSRVSTDKEETRISDDEGRDRYAPIAIARKRIEIASTKKQVMTEVVDERALLKEDRIESKVESRLSIITSSDDNSSDVDHNVARSGKDNSRLSKDRVVVAVNKHQPQEIKLAENANAKKVQKSADKKSVETEKEAPAAAVKTKAKPVSKEIAKTKLIWTVPTGVTPEYSVVGQIERGLDSVAEAAAEAGNKISEKVTSIGNNVKGAVAAPKKWEIPTGVTPGGDDAAQSIKVAETPVIDNVGTKTKDAVKLKKSAQDTAKSKVAVVVPKKLSKEKSVYSEKETDKKSEEGRLFVSSQLDDYSGAKIYDEKGKLVVAEVTKEEKSSKTGGLMKTIINLLTDPKKDVAGTEEKQGEKELVSRVDKVRFEAIKNLMVEDVDYKFINAKKGQGQIVVTGRSQADAKLSLYVGVRYLGDVIADNSGNWIFTKELYIPRGPHILQAQQMSKSGIAMARKTLPFKQTKKGKAPKGYDKNGIGIELGDKALATLRTKLKKDKQTDGETKKLTKAEARAIKKNKALAARTPLPVRKIGEKKLAPTKKTGEVKVAVLDKKADLKNTAKKVAKTEKKAADVKPSEKGKIKAVSKEQLSKDSTASEKKPAPKYYVVKRGDSLGRIAKRELGRTSAYKTILKLNKKLKSANLIYPGQKLLISAGLSEVVSKTEVKVKKKQVASLELPKVKPKEAKTSEKKTDVKSSHYVVKRGDSLWKIASKVYGNGRRYKELIKLNPKLLKNPASIKPNVKLRVKSS